MPKRRQVHSAEFIAMRLFQKKTGQWPVSEILARRGTGRTMVDTSTHLNSVCRICYIFFVIHR